MTEPTKVNYQLLDKLSKKEHPLLNIESIPPEWANEVLVEARTAHHLLDLVMPHGEGSLADIDARVYLAVQRILAAEEQLARIAVWHSRQTGPGGMVGSYCLECEAVWPCDTSKMANGTYKDEAND